MKTKLAAAIRLAVSVGMGGLFVEGRAAEPAAGPARPGANAVSNPVPGRLPGAPAAPAARPAGSLVNYQPGGGRGSVVRLVALPEVQEDLALSEPQKDAVAQVIFRLKSFEAEFAELLKQPPVAPPGSGVERQWVAAKQGQANQALTQARQELVRALQAPQGQRLEQLALQELGAEALFRPDVGRQLNLNPAQRQGLMRVREADAASVRAASAPPAAPAVRPVGTAGGVAGRTSTNRAPSGAGAGSPAAVRPPVQAPVTSGTLPPLSQEGERRMIQEVLTPQQRAMFEELKGRPIHFRSRPEEAWKREP